MSLRDLFTRFLDITTPPRPDLLVYFARCADDPIERETLETLSKVSQNAFLKDSCVCLCMNQKLLSELGILGFGRV